MGDAADDVYDAMERRAWSAEPNEDPPMCERCKVEEVDDFNVEAFEETGLVLCSGCADEAFEELADGPSQAAD